MAASKLPTVQAEEDGAARAAKFNAVGAKLAAKHGCALLGEEGELRIEELLPPRATDGGGRLFWDTLWGAGMLERMRVWRLPATSDGAASSDEAPGLAKLLFLVQLGDGICGHPQFIHGGFTAALFDELFAWCAFAERDARGFGEGAKVFTANLAVDYRRPVARNGVYLLELRAEKLVKGKKLFLRGELQSDSGVVLAESQSLYIIVREKPSR